MIKDETKKNMEQAIERLKHELSSIRTGRANPALLDSVEVEVYGTKMRLRDMSTVSVPESRQLLITPFDIQNKDAIRASIEQSNLGVTPFVDGNGIRINVPPLDEKVRQDMIKLSHKKKEEAKISIRNVRRDSNDTVKKQKSSGDITEDLMKKMEKEIQELTDKFCKNADELTLQKEKELAIV